MLKALQKQLRQERRVTRTAQLELGPPPAAGRPLEVARALSFSPAPEPEPPAGPLPPELRARLDAVQALHPRLHHSLSGLDEAQLAAVLSPDEALLLRAPVGSGKTTVLVHKVLYLHFIEGIPLRAIALLTFTNRAAAEIRGRIEQLSAGGLTADDFWLTGTFHGVARGLLARALPIGQLGYRADFSVLEEAEREQLIEQLIVQHRLRVGRRSQLRERLRQPRPGEAAPEGAVGRLAALFAEAKRARNAMDFDDLIAHATTLLGTLAGAALGASLGVPAADSAASASLGVPASSPDMAAAADPMLALPPRFILVDEMQDCEPRELDFLQRLRGPRTGFFAVGDPHQAIYGWRGSAPSLFARAEADFGCRTQALATNYRSTRTIVDGARAVLGLQKAAGGTSGALRAARSLGERMVVRRHHDPIAEALYLGERLTRLHHSGVPYAEIAVLYRLRAQAEPIRAALIERGIPCAESEESTPEAVRLLTLHAAKGLEFRYVFLSGINQGLCPLGHADKLGDDAEERRLLFVGLSRARDGVEISYHTRPHQLGALGEASSYLTWLPAALVDWSEVPGPVPAAPVPPAEAVPPVVGSAPAPAAPSAPPDAGPWQVGQAVRHPRYGEGVIVGVSGGNVDCTFGKFGARSFPVALCPLLPVASSRGADAGPLTG